MIEIGKLPMRSASAVISSLSMPTSGRMIGRVVADGDDRHVLERLRGDLAHHLARHERARAHATRAIASAMRIISRR